jgi:hypothetical protein
MLNQIAKIIPQTIACSKEDITYSEFGECKLNCAI